MYTLNLKDIDVEPRIAEDKSFRGEDEYRVVNEAVDYVDENYADTYNPYALRRKCTDALLHNDKTYEDERKERLDALSQKWEAEAQERTAAGKERREKFEEKAKPIYAKYKDMRTAASEKFDATVKELGFDLESEEYKKAQEEYLVALDSLSWEEDKELKTLREQVKE